MLAADRKATAARRLASRSGGPAASSELGRKIAIDFKADADLDESG
jgi:hypothetical protein